MKLCSFFWIPLKNWRQNRFLRAYLRLWRPFPKVPSFPRAVGDCRTPQTWRGSWGRGHRCQLTAPTDVGSVDAAWNARRHFQRRRWCADRGQTPPNSSVDTARLTGNGQTLRGFDDDRSNALPATWDGNLLRLHYDYLQGNMLTWPTGKMWMKSRLWIRWGSIQYRRPSLI